MAKGDAAGWSIGDMKADQAKVEMETVPTGDWFQSSDEAYAHIKKNGLNRVAKAAGGTVGVRKFKGRGGGYEIVIDRPKGGKKR